MFEKLILIVLYILYLYIYRRALCIIQLIINRYVKISNIITTIYEYNSL